MRLIMIMACFGLSACVVLPGGTLSGAQPGAVLGANGAPVAVTRQVDPLRDQSFGDILNRYRASVGSQELIFDERLNAAAQSYAETLAADPGYFARASDPHVGPDGSTSLSRIRAQGYEVRAYAENLGGNQRDEQAVLQAWMNSPAHDRNLRGAPLEDFGLGLAEASGGQTRWVLIMGAE